MSQSEHPENRSVPIIFEGYEDVPIEDTPLPLLDEETQRLREFQRLEPNWNSYGAKPISPETIDAASALIQHVVVALGAHPDIIAPIATGGVQVEWFGSDAEIEIRITPEKKYSYLYTEGSEYRQRRDVSLSEVVSAVSETLAK